MFQGIDLCAFGAYLNPMKRTNIHLTQPQREALDKIHLELGVPVAHLVRAAIDRYLERWRRLQKRLAQDKLA